MAISVKSRLILYADDSILIVSDKDPNVIEQKLEAYNQWLIETVYNQESVNMCCLAPNGNVKWLKIYPLNVREIS